jgi:hypothetical protein
MRGRATETWIYVNYTTYPYYGPGPTTVLVLVTGSDLPVSVSWGGIIVTAAVPLCSSVIHSTTHSIIHTFRRVSPILTKR